MYTALAAGFRGAVDSGGKGRAELSLDWDCHVILNGFQIDDY